MDLGDPSEEPEKNYSYVRTVCASIYTLVCIIRGARPFGLSTLVSHAHVATRSTHNKEKHSIVHDTTKRLHNLLYSRTCYTLSSGTGYQVPRTRYSRLQSCTTERPDFHAILTVRWIGKNAPFCHRKNDGTLPPSKVMGLL